MATKRKGKAGGTRPGAGRPTLYGQEMGTCELYLDKRSMAWLNGAAKRGKCSRSKVVRQLIDQQVATKEGESHA